MEEEIDRYVFPVLIRDDGGGTRSLVSRFQQVGVQLPLANLYTSASRTGGGLETKHTGESLLAVCPVSLPHHRRHTGGAEPQKQKHSVCVSTQTLLGEHAALVTEVLWQGVA